MDAERATAEACECEVTHIGGGAVTERPDDARCKKLAEAGAVRVRWPADDTRDVKEKETFSWHVLQEPMWRKDAHMGWRYTAGQLKKHGNAAKAADGKRQRR